MLRLHVVLNSPDGEEVLRQTDLAVLTGKAGQQQVLDLSGEPRTSSRVSLRLPHTAEVVVAKQALLSDSPVAFTVWIISSSTASHT